MRVAYVTIHISPEIMQGGVGRKIQNQTDIWREQGHEVSLFSLTSLKFPLPEGRQFVFHARTNILKRELNRAAALKGMLESIRAYKPDVIYVRYGLYSYPLHRIFRIAPVILEINSNDIEEYKYRGLFFYWMNRLTRGFILARSSGIVSPSHELSMRPENLKLRKRIKVISNGIDTRACFQYPPPENDLPVLVFVATPGCVWHGVDKLIELAVLCPDLQVELVGYGKDDIQSIVPDNIVFHGYVARQNIGAILSKVDVAVGTLALHRNSMQEASPLKVRESLCYGLPVIIAYDDTDLMDLDLEYILKLPNTEGNVRENIERIREFCYEVKGKRVNREVIIHRIDQRSKEQERLAFFEECISSRKTV